MDKGDKTMTKEELKKVPFKFCGHLSMADCHQSTYYNEQYGFRMLVVTKCYDEGMRFGRSRRHFYYNGKWYGWKKKFLEAIKDVEFKG